MTCTIELKGLRRRKQRQQRKQQPKQHLQSTLHRSQARIVDDNIWMWQNIQVWMIHGIMICTEGILLVIVCGIYLAWYETPAELCARWLSSSVTVWVVALQRGRCMWFLHLVNASMWIHQWWVIDNGIGGYLLDSYNIYFALYLHCISLMIALHVQLQLKRGYEILLVYLWTVACRYRNDGDCMVYSLFDLLRCMDDIFIASFGGFCDFIVSEAFWWISVRLCATGWFEQLGRWPVHVLGVWFPLQVFKMILLKSWLSSCMNACYLSREPATVQSFLRNNKLHQHTSILLVGCEKSRCHVCRGFRVFLVFVAGWRQ